MLTHTLRGHASSVTCVEFHPDGKSLYSGDENGWSIWWNLEKRRPQAIWQSHSSSLISTKFMANPMNGLVTHGRDNKLRIWRLDPDYPYNRTVLSSTSNPEDYPKPWLVHVQDVNALGFCPTAVSDDPPMLAVPATTDSEKIDVYTLQPFGRPIKALAPEPDPMAIDEPPKLGILMALALTPKDLVAGYDCGDVIIYSQTEQNQGSITFHKNIHKQPVLAVVQAKGTVWSSGADKLIARISNGDVHTKKLDHKGTSSLALTQNAKRLVTVGWDGYVRIFDSQTLEEQTSFKGGRQNGVTSVACGTVDKSNTSRRLKPLPDEWIAVGGKDNRIGLFELSFTVARQDAPK